MQTTKKKMYLNYLESTAQDYLDGSMTLNPNKPDQAEMAGLFELVKLALNQKEIPLIFTNSLSGISGKVQANYIFTGGRLTTIKKQIYIRTGRTLKSTLSTIFHELTHYYNHHNLPTGTSYEAFKAYHPSTKAQEREAENVACLVLGLFGIDTRNERAQYLQDNCISDKPITQKAIKTAVRLFCLILD